MRKFVILSLAFAVSVFAAASLLTVTTSGKKDKFRRSLQPIPNQYMVMLDENVVGRESSEPEIGAEAQYLQSLYGGNVKAVMSTAVKGFVTTMSAEQAQALSEDERVMFVEEDSAISAAETQGNAPWHLDRMDQRNLPMDGNFSFTGSGAGAHVYVLDSGIRTSHQEFGGRASVVYDAINDGLNGQDCTGHGTHVAGLAAGSTYGVAKNAFVHSVRVLPCTGSGQVSDLIIAIDWLTANRVNPAVANISITAPGTSPMLEASITNSVNAGVVFTIAAGNSAWNACDFTPARTPAAITVGATAQGDERPNYSNYGSCVDVFGPGFEIVSAGHFNDTAIRQMNGTSMSAPLVAGVVAVYRSQNPSATSSAVSQAVLNGSTSGLISNVGANSPNKLLYSWLAGGPAPTPTPTPTATPTPSPTATPSPTPTPNVTGRITIKKRVQNPNGGGPSSTATFPYQATNIPTANFTLVTNQEFTDGNVQPGSQTVAVTELLVAGHELIAVDCVEAGGQTVPNTTVDLVNKRANIKVESGETVTCTFTSQEFAPTGAEASVSGKVVDSRGKGVRGIVVTIQNAVTGQVRSATTNSFGIYSFDELEIGNMYVVTAFGGKRYTIDDNQQSFMLNDDRPNVDFVALRD